MPDDVKILVPVRRAWWRYGDAWPAPLDQRREHGPQLDLVAESRAGEDEPPFSFANAVAGIRWLEAGLWMRDVGERTLRIVEPRRVSQEAPGLPREGSGEGEPAGFDGERIGH